MGDSENRIPESPSASPRALVAHSRKGQGTKKRWDLNKKPFEWQGGKSGSFFKED